MMKTLVVAAALAGLLVLSPPARADEPLEALIAAHADSIVTVKFVLSVQIPSHGEREIPGTSTGVVVDATGLVVLSDRDLNPHFRMPQGQGLEIHATPTNVRVLFPGDPKEYESVVGATDTTLGLAFVRIKDLGDRKVSPVDLANAGEVAIGDRLYGVSRLDQGFDYAPWCDSVQVVGHITKPRKLWMIRGGFTEIGQPLYRADGTVVGFIVAQEAVGGGRTLPFLLPLQVAVSTIERAGKQAEQVLQEEREAAEGEAGDAASGETPSEGAPGEGKDGGETPAPGSGR